MTNPFEFLHGKYVQAHTTEFQWLGKVRQVDFVGGQAYATLDDAAPFTGGDYVQVSRPLTREEWVKSAPSVYRKEGYSERGTVVIKVDALREIPGPVREENHGHLAPTVP